MASVRGDGSVYRTKSGLWRGAFVRTTGPRAGKRAYVSGGTKREATRKLRKLQAEDRAGTLADPTRLTVGGWLQEWLASLDRRPNTLRSYEGVIKNHLAPRIGAVKLQQLSSRHIVQLYADLTAAGVGKRTLELAHTVLCASLTHARKHRLIIASPCDLVEKPRYQAPEMETYDAAEVRALLDAAESLTTRVAVGLMVLGGLRWGEAVGLRWRDVDLERGTISIQRQLIEQKEGDRVRLVEGPPKSEQGRRRVSIGAVLVADLAALRKEQMASKRGASELVLAGTRGKPLRNSNFARRKFAPLCERAGVRQLRLHDLRHTCATLLMGAGVSPKVVAERLGNDVVVTMKIYSHVQPDMQRAATALLEGMLAGGA